MLLTSSNFAPTLAAREDVLGGGRSLLPVELAERQPYGIHVFLIRPHRPRLLFSPPPRPATAANRT